MMLPHQHHDVPPRFQAAPRASNASPASCCSAAAARWWAVSRSNASCSGAEAASCGDAILRAQWVELDVFT